MFAINFFIALAILNSLEVRGKLANNAKMKLIFISLIHALIEDFMIDQTKFA